MLTLEELKEKCQELYDVADALMSLIRVDDYTYKSNLNAHEYLKDKLIKREESLVSTYLENRNSISDEAAKEIVTTLMMLSTIRGYIFGSDKKDTPKEKWLDIYWHYFM